MGKYIKWQLLLIGLLAIVLVGCSNKKQVTQPKQQLSGVYKIADKDADTDDDGNEQPGYYYFKKDGTVLWAQPETGDDDSGNYGGAARGTWKTLGNNKFKIHLQYIYDTDVFTFTAKKTGNKLHTYSNSRKSRFEWDADDNYKQPQMDYSDFMLMADCKK
ncbi:hypothetical protein [Limosilactobacillus sp.]|uniref:hypothetical protein n=1 Tax=Limosilactobacillus sp. TaxID=2773925 RepID=UPI0035A0744A